MHPMLRNVLAIMLMGFGLYLLWQEVGCGLGSDGEACSTSGTMVLGQILMIALGFLLLRYGPVLMDEAEAEDV